ncbi:MAG: amidohydrolase family protein [Halieaceae bacterium]
MPVLKLLLPILALLAPFASAEEAAAPRSADLIVRGDYVLTMAPETPLISDGAVVVENGVIVAVGAWAEIEASYRAPETLPGAGRILMPGLINGHTHTSMTLFRGMVDDLDLMTWLNQYVFPMEGRFVDPEFVRIGTELACWEMIQGGTTSFVDMYFYPEVIAQVVVDCGLRAVVAAPHIDFPSPGFKGWDDSFAAAIAFVKAWQGRNPRITPAFAPHAPYTVSPEHIAMTAAVAGELNAPVSMHLAEAPSETEYIWERYETSPIQHVNTTGLFEDRVIGAHMVQLDQADIELVASKGVGAIHNPTSNMKLGAGVAPVVAMLEAGVNVGLGTDGAASNNDLDMWEEIRLAALLHKLKSADPTAIPAPTALAMATRLGAAATGLDAVTGSIKPGLQADLIQVDFTRTRQQPLYDVPSHLVYVLDSQDVVTTIVAGRILMRERQVLTIDEAALRRAVQRKREEIRKALAASENRS